MSRTRITTRGGGYLVVEGSPVAIWRELHDPDSERWARNAGGVKTGWMEFPEGFVNAPLVTTVALASGPYDPRGGR